MNDASLHNRAMQIADAGWQQRCDAVLERMHTHRGHAAAVLEQLLDDDPGCVQAHCLRAGLIVHGDDTSSWSALRTSLDAIDAAKLEPADPARRHAAAARAWLDGDSMLALARYGDLVADQPHDMLALIVAHALDFRMARWEMLRDRIAAVLPHWHAGMRGYASVLAMYAFGLEENGEYRKAEKTARDALAIDPMHVGAMHALVHVLEMEARAREGLAFLAENEAAWSEGNGYAIAGIASRTRFCSSRLSGLVGLRVERSATNAPARLDFRARNAASVNVRWMRSHWARLPPQR